MPQSAQVLASSFVALRSRDDEWEERLAMMRRARRFLYTSTYYVGGDSVGQAALEALGDTAERGVDTILMVDRFGQRLGASAYGLRGTIRLRRWFRRAAARGVRLVWTEPRSWTRKLVGGGHHVKIQLCESGPAMFASTNLSRHSFEEWGEFSALLDGPVVETLLAALNAVDPAPAGHRLDRRSAGPNPLALRWWWFDPDIDTTWLSPLRRGQANPITTGLIERIEGASRSVAISSFYVKPEPCLDAAILSAARRGVRVEIFHSGPDALGGPEASWLAAALGYRAWLEAGVVLHEVTGGEHSKLVLIDEREAMFGSYNLDHAAHDLVAEAMLSSTDPRVVTAISDVFQELRVSEGTLRIAEPRRAWSLRRRAHARLVAPVRRWI